MRRGHRAGQGCRSRPGGWKPTSTGSEDACHAHTCHAGHVLSKDAGAPQLSTRRDFGDVSDHPGSACRRLHGGHHPLCFSPNSSCSTAWGPGASLPAQAGRTETGLGMGHREGKTEENDSTGHPRHKPGPGNTEWGHALSRECPRVPVTWPRRCLGTLWMGFGKASPGPPDCCGLQAPAITENRCAPAPARDCVTTKLRLKEDLYLLKAEAGCVEAHGLGW